MAVTAEAASIESGTISCSVCLEIVSDVGERSFAKLKCGHYFHLDCIGSAFNAKGSMQCPNCRRVEDGRWLYASGCRQQEEVLFADLPSSEDVYSIYEDVHHELVRHVYCPYLTLDEMDSPVPGYPDPNVVLNVLYGEQHPTVSTPAASPHNLCPFFSAATESYWTASRPIVDELVVVQNQVEPPSGGGGGGSIGGNIRGPHSFPVHERTGWASQSGGAHNPVGTMNDVGLASLPIERFRWSAPANRSDALQPGYSGQLRSPENSPSPWHRIASNVSNVSSATTGAPGYVGSSRRSRQRGYGSPSSSTGRVAGSRAAPPRENHQAREWQRRRESQAPGFDSIRPGFGREWQYSQAPGFEGIDGRPWFQSVNFPAEAGGGAASAADGYGNEFHGQQQHYYYGQFDPRDELRRSSHHQHRHAR